MIILSNGYKLPETGDFGDVWFPSLEYNITRVNGHTHNGSDSEKIQGTSVVASVQTITSASFSASGSEFVALITLAGGLVDVDTKHVVFRDPTTKEQIHIRYEKFSQTQINVYTSFVQDIEVLVV